MKLIDKNNCTEIGQIKKTHGTQGEVVITFDRDYADIIDDSMFLFIETEGLPVPFYIEELNFRSDSMANVIFEGLDTQVKAKALVGSKVLIDTENIAGMEVEFNSSHLEGYMLIDTTLGEIGSIERVDNYAGNLVLTVTHNRTEKLIPLAEALIVKFDAEKRELTMNCPEGILNLED